MSACWKLGYDSPQEAYNANTRLPHLRAYRCKQCGRWHMTSQSENPKAKHRTNKKRPGAARTARGSNQRGANSNG